MVMLGCALVLQVTLVRPVRDLRKRVPDVEVAIDLPSMKASLLDREYQLITSVAGANLSEATRVPEASRWLQRQHLPGTLPPDADEDGADTADVEGPSPRVPLRDICCTAHRTPRLQQLLTHIPQLVLKVPEA